jgi:acetyl-CoA carboxylase alpha subunit
MTLKKLQQISSEERLKMRYKKFREIGVFTEK